MDKRKAQKESVLTVTLNSPKTILNNVEVRTKPRGRGKSDIHPCFSSSATLAGLLSRG